MNCISGQGFKPILHLNDSFSFSMILKDVRNKKPPVETGGV